MRICELAKMWAIQITEYGGPEVLKIAEVERPFPKSGEVLIKLDLAGVSFGDTYMRRGYYAPPHTYPTKLPYTPGLDGSGTIAALGEGVEGWSLGDYVTYCLGHHSYAQYVVVPAWKLVKIPDDIGPELACAFMINGLTSYYLTHMLYPLKEGDRALLHAAAGSVGQIVLQLAKIRGARVIATVASTEKGDIVRKLGAEEVIFYQEEDFVERVRDWTDGEGVDIAYDSVGKETYRRSMQCLRRRGTCSLYGAASGIPDCVRPMEDLAENGSIFVTRSHLAHYMTDADEIKKATNRLFDYHRRGDLKVALDPRRFGLSEAASAHRSLEARETIGKILLHVAS